MQSEFGCELGLQLDALDPVPIVSCCYIQHRHRPHIGDDTIPATGDNALRFCPSWKLIAPIHLRSIGSGLCCFYALPFLQEV
jgi:hypothetical protein